MAGVALLLGCGPAGLSRGVWLSEDGDKQLALELEEKGYGWLKGAAA